MQINLPIEPAPPPAPGTAETIPSSTEPMASFEQFLGVEQMAALPKLPTADPAAALPVLPELPKQEEATPADPDPTVAATLAALSMTFPAPLPPPPVVTPEVAPASPTPVAVAPVSSEQLQREQAVPAAEVAVNTAIPSQPELPAALTTPPQVIATPVEKAEKPEAPEQEAEVEETSTEEPAPVISTPRSLPSVKSGTPDALDRNTMPNALINRQVKAKAATLAVNDKAPPFAAAPRPVILPRNMGPVAARPVATFEIPSPAISNLAPPAVESAISLPAAAAETKMERVTNDVHLTLSHVERLTEALQTSGRQQVEMEVKLHDDSKVTISMQMERGELKTTFRTDSNELRDALANNWGQVTEKNSDRSIRLTPPVFQSSDARNGFSGDARQQSRDGRTFTQPDAEGSPIPFRAPARSTSAGPATTAPAVSALELYA